jgi:hypothetical protein
MRYVLGMAKSSLDTRGGKGRNLELDFVRLVLAVRTMTADGSTAHGYLLVLDERVASPVRKWQRKYAAQDLVSILVHTATASEQDSLREEKRLNALAITTQTPSQPSASAASLGEAVAEKALRAAINESEPGVVEAPPDAALPLGVRWDFFGTRNDSGA